jgi:hypothetical protein
VSECTIKNIELNYCIRVFAFSLVPCFICCNNIISVFYIKGIEGILFFKIRIKKQLLHLVCIVIKKKFYHSSSNQSTDYWMHRTKAHKIQNVHFTLSGLAMSKTGNVKWDQFVCTKMEDIFSNIMLS